MSEHELHDSDGLMPELEAVLRSELTPPSVVNATRARLLARATAVKSAPLTVSAGSRGARVPRAWFISTVVALAASLLLLVRASTQQQEMRATFATADQASTKQLDSLSKLVAARDQFVASLTGSQVSVVGLSSSAAKEPRALMFWDKATDKWTFIAHNLEQLKPGRTYQLWLVTGKDKISAGTFSVSPKGDAVVQATYALDRNALKAVAVTEEPEGGVPVATGALIVVGTVGTK